MWSSKRVGPGGLCIPDVEFVIMKQQRLEEGNSVHGP